MTETSTNGAFQVSLDVFEGPLDLLLKLIERKQLDISKVALAEVADSFLGYVSAHPDIPSAPLASFVWIASKLILIKSQALLPRPPVPVAGDDDEDPGDELVRRLEAYKRVKDAARWLREREVAGLRSYERPALLSPMSSAREQPVYEPGSGLEGVSMQKLVRLVQKRMQLQMSLQMGPPKGTITSGHVVTVAEKVSILRARMNKLG